MRRRYSKTGFWRTRGCTWRFKPIWTRGNSSNRRPFKHRLEAQIASVVVHRRKLTNDIHADTAPLHFQVSGLRSQVSGKQNAETRDRGPISNWEKASPIFPLMDRATPD